MQQMRTEKDELHRLRKIASSIAKEVKHFWDSIQKVGHAYCKQPSIYMYLHIILLATCV